MDPVSALKAGTEAISLVADFWRSAKAGRVVSRVGPRLPGRRGGVKKLSGYLAPGPLRAGSSR
jgi:hypothetical protein